MLLWHRKEKDFSNLLKEENWEDTMEQKISELFTDTLPKMNQQKPKSLLEYASQAIKERKREPLTLSIHFDSALTLITSICDGTILARFLDLGFDSEVDSTLVLDILKFVLSLAEKFFTPSGDKIDYEDIVSSFNSCASSLQRFVGKDGNNEIVDAVVGYVPDIMKIYLTLEGDSKDLENTKVNVLAIIKKVINQVAFPQRKELLYNLLTIVLGINMNIFDEQNPGTKLNFDVQPSDRIRIFITKILPAIFPQLTNYCKEEDFIKVYDLIVKLNTDFKTNFKDIQIQRQIVIDIATLLAHFRVCDPGLVNSIVSLMDGNIEGAKYLLQMVLPDSVPNENLDRMISYVVEMKSMLNIDFSSKLALSSKAEDKKKKNMDELSWAAIMKKIAEGKASSKDLFKVVDQEGDNSGTISTSEFEILANRLGIKLSEHRIKEIFAKVKENKARGSSEYELNEKEFEEALGYLESKNLTQALQILGITPEILTAILIRLIILLILIFAFIFVGISAFAIGGTFGAIINSLFPVAGGAGLSKQSDTDKDKLESTNVTKAAETGLDITFSEQL